MRTFTTFVENQQLLGKIQTYLAGIERAGFRLLVHQTDSQTALNIVKNQDFSHKGVHGTTTFMGNAMAPGSTQALELLQRMAFKRGEGPQVPMKDTPPHHSSDALIIMAIPRKIARSTMDLDDHLADLVGQDKLKNYGIPNQYILGFWKTNPLGEFAANGKFPPDGKFDPKKGVL